MTKRWIAVLATALLLSPLGAQIGGRRGGPGSEPFGTERDKRMPDGRSRTLMILKSDAEKSSADMAKVIELATALQKEIDENQFHTVDLGSVRKAEEIIKLVRRVKSRLSRAQ